MNEPPITEIASYFATHLPDGDVEHRVARNGWRHAIRLARERGADIRWLTDFVLRQAPHDPTLRAHCDALLR